MLFDCWREIGFIGRNINEIHFNELTFLSLLLSDGILTRIFIKAPISASSAY